MEDKKTDKNHTVTERIVLGVILIFPVIAGQLLSILFLLALLALLCSFLVLGVLGIIELVAGVALVGVGIEKIFSMPMGSVAVMGFGIVNIGVAVLMECFVLWMYGVALPAMFRKMRNGGKKDEKAS